MIQAYSSSTYAQKHLFVYVKRRDDYVVRVAVCVVGVLLGICRRLADVLSWDVSAPCFRRGSREGRGGEVHIRGKPSFAPRRPELVAARGGQEQGRTRRNFSSFLRPRWVALRHPP